MEEIMLDILVTEKKMVELDRDICPLWQEGGEVSSRPMWRLFNEHSEMPEAFDRGLFPGSNAHYVGSHQCEGIRWRVMSCLNPNQPIEELEHAPSSIKNIRVQEVTLCQFGRLHTAESNLGNEKPWGGGQWNIR